MTIHHRSIGRFVAAVVLAAAACVPSAAADAPPQPFLQASESAPAAGVARHVVAHSAAGAGTHTGDAVQVLDQIGGSVSAVALDGRVGYIGVGPRVGVVDLADLRAVVGTLPAACPWKAAPAVYLLTGIACMSPPRPIPTPRRSIAC